MAPRLFHATERDEVAAFIERHWNSRMVMSCGKCWYPHEHEGFLERRDGQIVGLVTFRCEQDAMELLTINSTVRGAGLGSALMLAVFDEARRRGIRRMWLTTTNDNLHAVGFYQRLGFRLTEAHLGAVDAARKVKPQIPEVGHNGIPIHDEWVMELRLDPAL